MEITEILINVKVVCGLCMLLCFAVIKRNHIKITEADADYLIGAILLFETIGILGPYPWDIIGSILLRLSIAGILLFKVIFKTKQA